MSTVTRVYATQEQTNSLAQWMLNKGFRPGQAKAYLTDPKRRVKYQIRGVNFRYKDLDQAMSNLLSGTTQQYNAVDTRDVQIQHYAELFSGLQQCSNIRQVRKLLSDFQPTHG